MIEEPYRWVEAIANRREYIETQLASGSPIVALSCRDGILFLTIGQARQKLFEIYDRIAMGAIGHPGDIERLRMAAIELASTEGFTRSAADVSLRRLAYFSLSPVLKNAFEQVYGAPFLARMIFAEIGAAPENDLFLRLEYDGSISTDGAAPRAKAGFSAISGTAQATELMEDLLQREHKTEHGLKQAMRTALDAWSIGSLPAETEEMKDLRSSAALAEHRQERLNNAVIEAALLEREGTGSIRYRQLGSEELKELTA